MEQYIKKIRFSSAVNRYQANNELDIPSFEEGTEYGYELAIKHACEWLVINVRQYVSLEFLPESGYPQGDVEVESLLKAFKQAMKED